MQTSIDRTSRRALERRRVRSYAQKTEPVRSLAWLTWALVEWAGSHSIRTITGNDIPETLHAALVHRLRASPRGLYALSLTGPACTDFRIVEVTGPRLGSAAHVIATMAAADATQNQRWSQRLRLLGECIRESASSPTRLAGSSLLEQAAWRLNHTGIQAPAAVDRLVQRRRGLALPDTDKAIFDFFLRMGVGRLSQFLAALELLAEECHRVDQEPTRRRQVLSSILQEAAATQPPYLPQFFSARPATATQWRLNAYFGDAAVKIFLRDHLPEAVSRHWPSGTRENYTFEKMCLQLVDIELAPFNTRRQPASVEPPDAVAQLRALIPEVQVSSSETSKAQLTNLAVRYAIMADDPEAPRTIAIWMKACRQFTRLSIHSDEIWQRVISSLEDWTDASSRMRENVCRLLEILAAFSPEIVSIGWMKGSPPGAAFNALARFGALSAEEVANVMDFDLLDQAHQQFRGISEQLSALLGVLPPNRRHWSDLKPGHRNRWFKLFAEIEDGALARTLAGWFVHLRHDCAFAFLDISGFAREIERFLARKCSERRVRERFLAGHMALLDRILDEVETTLLELPVEGFERWRSHVCIWNTTIDALEILFEWESAEFADSPAMLAELFQWCRLTTRKAMAEKMQYPPGHFQDVCRNEAIVVRLSAGLPRQLLRLLERYTEFWCQPDDPIEGWRFLHRYPAVRQALQKMCRQPRRLYGTMRVLRRMALAVRLQQRKALCEGLDRWAAAWSQSDPVDRIRGFREICCYEHVLPPEVEHIRQRARRLQRECDTLSAMEQEGRLTPSASVRLAKLKNWLKAPETMTRWIDRDTRRAVEKSLLPAQFNALSEISREAVRTHWKAVIDPQAERDGPDWDNALHFYYSAEKNKDLLRELLRHADGRHAEWRLRHAPNVKFADGLRERGLQIEQWLAPLSITRQVHGTSWNLHLEQDPLRVLQMGNLFSTCLSLDDCNAFAAIANAAEINKQVLYLEDAKGTVIGRKLIGLTTDGRLFGFKSYGAACLDDPDRAERPEVWIKVLLDLACLQIVDRLGGQFDRSPDVTEAAEKLKLSADWYNDGPEPFDWWIAHRDLSRAILQNEKQQVADAVTAHIRQKGLKLEEDGAAAMESLRALLWLEDEAGRVIESLGREAIPAKCARFLRCQSSSAAVRAMLATS